VWTTPKGLNSRISSQKNTQFVRLWTYDRRSSWVVRILSTTPLRSVKLV